MIATKQGRRTQAGSRRSGLPGSSARRPAFDVRPAAARARGFTLIEVLVSLAIFALAAVVLGSAYVNVLLNFHNMQRRSGERSEIAMVRGLLLAEADRKVVEEGGEMPLPEGGSIRWRAELEETDVADLFRVNLALEIAPAGPTAARPESQTFLLLRPGWSDPEKRERLRTAARERLAKSRS